MLRDKMTPLERRAVFSLASIMSLRLIGLFMVLPLFALYAHNLKGATPGLIGLAMGIYGLTQGLFQIPFGMLSDYFGRKPIILLGLLIFALGSIISAYSHDIFSMIIGRALQGAGAVGSTIIAMIADLTREEQRTKAMAINGMIIGVSFSIAMILGPLLSAWLQVSGIFWLAALFSFIGIFLLFTIVPTPLPDSLVKARRLDNKKLLIDPQLARLNVGIFLLHALFTASFVVIPITLVQFIGMPGNKQWILYLPTLIAAFLISFVLMIRAEKQQQVKNYFLGAIAILMYVELAFWLWPQHTLLIALHLFLFFTAFSLLEAFLPSLVSRAAPAAYKGTALGIYSCSQYLGIFVGGALGGTLYGIGGLQNVYLFCAALALIWLAIAWGMRHPKCSSS